MRLLLDTHALIWALAAPAKLPRALAKRLEDPDHLVMVSAATTWEIAIKAGLGKIRVDLAALAEGVRKAGFLELPISVGHTLRVRELPPHHRDPFDRILVAQALEEGLTIVTHDPVVGAYAAPTLWAG